MARSGSPGAISPGSIPAGGRSGGLGVRALQAPARAARGVAGARGRSHPSRVSPDHVGIPHRVPLVSPGVHGRGRARRGAVRCRRRGGAARRQATSEPIGDTRAMTADRASVSIVAPVFNESRTLPEFIRRIAAVCDTLAARYTFEILVVDDGSTDDSLQVATRLMTQEPRMRVIELRRNFGQTAALQAGLAAAAGDIIISMDSDLQHFPEDIPQFLSTLEQGYDLVCGWRHERKEGIIRRWPSRAANLIIKKVCGLKIHDFG